MTSFKRRSESFLGMHFDFHAQTGREVPSCYDPESYALALDAVKPDYIQCDTKGHPGLSSYPTKVGNRAQLADGIDLLKTMRDLTAQRGIALYAHHSGIYERKVVELHPDWAVVGADGKPSSADVSVFSPYVDEVLIPQLKEIAGDYGLDGAWIDGDNWACCEDYSHWATDAYKAATGKEPGRPGEEGYVAYREFCREGFKNYVRKYIREVKAEFPDFQITSNWIFSSKMPDAVDVPVDFLSGDTAPNAAVDDADFQGHFFEARALPWDLMMWGFRLLYKDGDPAQPPMKQSKSLIQHCQEAAMILSLGGGFEFYNIQYGNGGVTQRWMIPTWAKLAEFARERSICHGGHLRPELGILIPMERNENSVGVFSVSASTRAGISWIFACQETQHSSKLILESTLTAADLKPYKAIIVPGSQKLAPATIALLKDYVSAGGHLLLDGPAACHFQDAFQFRVEATAEKVLTYVDGGDNLGVATTRRYAYATDTGSLCGNLMDSNFYDKQSQPAYMKLSCGRGQLCALGFDFSASYSENRCDALRSFLLTILYKELTFTPDIRVAGSSYVQTLVLEKDGKILVNLINMAGAHNVSNAHQFNELPPLGPITVTVAPALPFTTARLVPTDRPLELTTAPDGTRQIVLPKLDVHAVIVLE